MSQTEIDQLIDQLSAGDAKTRRAAAKKLGELERPEAIAELVNVYMKDDDSNVRKAAEDSLRIFRRMEQDMLGGEDGANTGTSTPGTFLPRIRTLLIITLVLTLLGNVALVVGKLLPQPAPATPVQTAVTPRGDLITAFKKRIEDTRTNATLLRQMYSAVQGMGAQALNVNKPGCEKLQTAKIDKVDLGNLDAVTYPDLRDVNDQINSASLKILSLRNQYVTLCTSRDANEFNKLLNDQGGAAKKVAEVDEATNKDLTSADLGLQKAIDHPAPTVGPTFTPTTPPTETPTITPSPRPPTATGAATATPAVTSAPPTVSGPATTAAPTSAPSVSFKGLQLETLQSYRYKVNVRLDGSYPNGKKFSGSVQITASRQTSPLSAQYDVKSSEVNTPKDLIKNIAGGLYAPGNSQYIILDGVRYATGNILDTIRPKVQCQAVRVTDKTTLPDFAMPTEVNDMTFARQPPDDTVNDVKALRYHGEKKGGDKDQFLLAVDLYLAADSQLPIRVIEKTTLPSPGQTGYADFTLTTQYDLLSQGQDVKPAKPLVCQDVPIK